MAELIKDINPSAIASAYVGAPFDQAKTVLEKEGYKIISLEENAILRMQEGKNHDVSRNGNYTREGVLYLPNKKIYLTKNSPIMDNAKKATECHRNGKEFYLNNNQLEQALEDSVQISQREIPTNRFADDELTVYAFGQSAQKYGEFLRKAGIKEMPIYLANLESKPFARQMWFRDLGGGSVFDGDGRDLNYDGGVRGVRNSAEGTTKNSAERVLQTYTHRELKIVKNMLEKSGIVGNLNNLIINALREYKQQ